MTNREILDIIRRQELDIRLRGPLPRPFDQKVTVDVVNTIARVILEMQTSTFTNKNIEKSSHLRKAISDTFGKPTPDNPTTFNEYDKFVSQITNMFEFAGILTKTGKLFSIIEKDLLSFIADSWENTTLFLTTYIEETVDKSGMLEKFMIFLNLKSPNKNDYDSLRDYFNDYFIKYTNIKKTTEPQRIIGKVLNILAYKYETQGSKGGSASKERIILMDLLYSKSINSRDSKKRKGETRADYNERTKRKNISKKQENVMKKYVKEVYGNVSAISGLPGLQVHHILMKSNYEEFSADPENLIPLTAQEHTQDAHPNGNFQKVDKVIQIKLLKIQRKMIQDNPDKFNIDVFNAMLDAAEIVLDN